MPSPAQTYRPTSLKAKDAPDFPSKKKCKDKAKWVATEEAAMITTLLTQKGARNSSESGFKAVVWSLVVTAVAPATAVTTKKDLMQCKTCYHRVCHLFSHFSHWLTSQALFTAPGRI